MPKLLMKLFGVAAGALLLVIATATLVRHELSRTHGASEGTTSLLSYLSPTALWLADLPQNLYYSLTNPFSFQFIAPDLFPGHIGFVGEPNQKESYLLLSRVDGDIGKPVAELVDLRTFEVQHTWVPDLPAIADVWNKQVAELDDPSQLIDTSSDRVIHPMLVGDGLVFGGHHNTIKKVDACSNLQWQVMHAPNEVFHHSIQVDIDGNIWSLSEDAFRLHPRVKDGFTGRYYLDHSIVKLNPDGEILLAKSISDMLTENGLGYLMWGNHSAAYTGDWLHANEVHPADTDTQYWKKGDVLISLHAPSMVFLYRPSNNKLIWHTLGYVTAQHDPNFVDESRISIFDNNTPFGIKPKPPVDESVVDETVWSDGHSQVIVYDFTTEQYSSYLNDSLREHNVRGSEQSRSDILPDGDLFVEETPNSRILYFNADGSLRWSHVNRANDGNVYALGWSRILYLDHEIALVREFLNNKDEQLEACRDPS